MSVFFSDLDATLIYSHRRNIPDPKVLAEYFQGREQSYMTENTFQYLQTQTDYQFVPVTTRTEEQFKRIFLIGREIPCHYALVCNGAVLLKDGQPDPEWLRESERLAAEELAENDRMAQLLRQHYPPEHVHTVERFMVYMAQGDTVQLRDLLQQNADPAKVLICLHRNKVYCIARSLTKGKAVQRFRERFGCGQVFAAGDSALDVSMLNAADTAFVPRAFVELVTAPEVVPLDGEIISDQICTCLQKRKEG